MKFSEMVYTRPDYPAVLKELEALTQKLSGAKSSQEQVAIYKECETLLSHLETQTTLCYIRHSVNTRDSFYEAQNDYNDQQAPFVTEKAQEFTKALLESPFRAELEKALGSLLFQNLELEQKGFSQVGGQRS